MAITRGMSVDELDLLASRLAQTVSDIDSILNSLKYQCGRGLDGGAAEAYDTYLYEWEKNQQSFLANIRSAAHILKSIAISLRENGQTEVAAFG